MKMAGIRRRSLAGYARRLTVLTPEERAYLTEDDLRYAEIELTEVQEILDHMFEQVAAL